MNRLQVASVSAAAAVLLFAAAAVSAHGLGRIRCFSDGTSTCVLARERANLTVYSGGYAGIYLNRKTNTKHTLASKGFSFTANGSVAGGAPRFSIPININGGTTTDGFAFLDVAGCGGTANNPATVSTGDPNCHVNYNGVDYDNWAELAATFPNGKLSASDIPFIIADQPGTYSVYNIDLR